MSAFNAFRDAVDASSNGFILSGWFVLLAITGFLGVIFGGAVIVDKDGDALPYCVGCIIAAGIAAYKIGGF